MEALLFVFGIQGTHSIFVCSCCAAALSSLLFFGAFYAPEAVARSPEGVFGGRSLSPICGPVGFRGVAPHLRPVYPEHLHRISAISHGDSSVRPSFHLPRRLDDLLGSSGRVPPGSDPSGIASVSSLNHGRSLLSVQSAVLRVDAKVFKRLMAPISAILHRYGECSDT